MFRALTKWYDRKFGSKDIAVFFGLLVVGLLVIIFLGNIIAPILASIVIAFLLETLVQALRNWFYMSRFLAVLIVYLMFLTVFASVVVLLVPLLVEQLTQLLQNVPNALNNLHDRFLALAQTHPKYISPERVNEIFQTLSQIELQKLASIGKPVLEYSLSTLPGLITALVYFFLVPVLVFFFMKDKNIIINAIGRLLPEERSALQEVWWELKPALDNYVKGKVIEMFIVALAAYISFALFNLNYTLLLAVGVGISVFIPYVGMLVITVPVVIIGLMQFGFTAPFFYLIAVYALLQLLDGNVLVPLLFAGVVQLHPIVVIAAVLIFGSIWGFWGAFFAIPLASLTQAILHIWLRYSRNTTQSDLS
jgi:putative permease